MATQRPGSPSARPRTETNIMRKAFGIAAFAATVAATALALSRAGVQTSGPGWQEKDLASLKTDVEHLRREQRSLEDLTRATAARAEEQQSNRGGGAGTDHEASAAAATQELAPAAANDHPATAPAPTAKEMKEAVEARFFSQERDPVWSKDAVARLSDQLVPRLPQGSRITSLDCLQTMCRVEVVHSSL